MTMNNEANKKEAFLAILTPSYNRAHLLPRLYESLLLQTNKEFKWIIVDDGSTDDTKELLRGYIDDGKLNIEYIYQHNGGKHRALNNGIQQIKNELTFIVDSDDYLPNDAIEIISNYNSQYRHSDEICGYSFLRVYEDGTVNTGYFPKDEWITDFATARIKNNLLGDKAEVFKTNILKEYPFPEYEKEKFLPEDIVWMQMSWKYKMVHINKCIYISEYLEGGLTKLGRDMKKKSPKGMILRSNIYLDTKGLGTGVYIKMMLLYIIYGYYAEMKFAEMLKRTNRKFLYLLLFLPAKLLLINW